MEMFVASAPHYPEPTPADLFDEATKERFWLQSITKV
jgi:hypothetical protein